MVLPRTLVAALAVAALLAPAAHAAAPTLNPVPGLDQVDGDVTSVAVSGDTLYATGSFQVAGPRTGPAALIDADRGGRPLPFPVLGNASQFAETAVTDGQGGWIVGGPLGYVDGQKRNGLVHVKADGSLDAAFPQTEAGGRVVKLERVGDTLYVAGSFQSLGGQARTHLARVDLSTGTVDPAFAPTLPQQVYAMTIDGNAIFVTYGNTVAKLSATTGAADPTWVKPTVNNGIPVAVAADATGVYLGGNWAGVNASTQTGVVRLDRTTGAVDAAYQPALGPSPFVSMLRLGDGGLEVGGQFDPPSGDRHDNLIRLGTGATATVDAGFQPFIQGGSVRGVSPAGDGRLYVVGNFAGLGGQERPAVARIDAVTGKLDTTFRVDVDSTQASTGVLGAVLDGDRVMVVGGFNIVGARRQGAAAFDLATGRLTDWDPRLDNGASQVAVAADGSVVLAGQFTKVGGETRRGLAEVTPGTGALVPAFDAGLDGSVDELALAGGRAYVAGSFDHAGSAVRNGLAAVSVTDGAVDPDWDPAPDDYVNALAADATSVYVGGSFEHVGGAARTGIAKLSATGAGAADPSFDPGADGYGVDALALAGDTLLAAGDFANIGGLPRPNVAALSTSDGTVSAFAPAVTGEPESVAIDANRRAFAGPAGYDLDSSSQVFAVGAADDSVYAYGLDARTLAAGGEFYDLPGSMPLRLKAFRAPVVAPPVETPTATPSPVPSATPSPTPTPVVTVPPAVKVTATCKRVRGRRRAVRCRVSVPGRVAVTLRRRGRVVARAKGTGTITLRPRKALRRGRYTLRIDGAAVKVRIR